MVKLILRNLKNWMRARECLFLILLHLLLASLHCFSQPCSSFCAAPAIWSSTLGFSYQLSHVRFGWHFYLRSLVFCSSLLILLIFISEKVCSTQLRIFGVHFKKGLQKGSKCTNSCDPDYSNIYDTEFHWAIYVKLLPDDEPLFKGRRQKISEEAMDILD